MGIWWLALERNVLNARLLIRMQTVTIITTKICLELS